MSQNSCREGTATFPFIHRSGSSLSWLPSLPPILSYSHSGISSSSLFQATAPLSKAVHNPEAPRDPFCAVFQINPTRSSSPDPFSCFCWRLPSRWICLCFPSTKGLDPDFCGFVTIHLGTFHIGAHQLLNRTPAALELLMNYLMGAGFSSSSVSQLLSCQNNQTGPLVKELQKFQKSKKKFPDFYH